MFSTPLCRSDRIRRSTSAMLLAVGTGIGIAANGVTLSSTTMDQSGALPSPWVTTDIGNPLRVGSATYESGVFVVKGGGIDIDDNADQFRFVYQALDGDGQIVARVNSLERTDIWAKAGLMIREDLTAGSRNAFVFVTPERGLVFQRRITPGAATIVTRGGAGAAPYWLKLEREGTTFRAYVSTNGSAWTGIGGDIVTMNRRVYVGLAVTSRDYRERATASFTNVAVTIANQAPSVALTEPVNNASFTAPATITLNVSASDADNGIARVDFHAGSNVIGSDSTTPYSYAWSNVQSGTYSLRAVAYDNGGASALSAAVDVIVTAAVNQVPVVSLMSPATNSTFTLPATITVSATASDADGAIAGVDFYAGSSLIASDPTSPYSVPWSNPPAGAYTLTAVARDNSGATATSAPASVTVRANQPPAVSLAAPTPASFTAPAMIALTATATDSDGTVTGVDFYHGGSTLISSDATHPYTAAWNGVPAGTYTVTAVARDNGGRSTTSAPVVVTVAPAISSIAFNASPDHDMGVTHYVVEIFRAGADPATVAPFSTENVGKPTPSNGVITVNVATTMQALPAGSYFATISATGAGGTSRSAPSEIFER